MRNAVFTGLAVLLGGLIISWSGCAKQEDKFESDATSGEILAVVNGENITRDMFERNFYWLSEDAQKAVSQNPSELLSKMIDQELLYQQGLKLKLDSRADVKRKLWVAERLTRQTTLAGQVVEKEINAKVSVTDEEIRKYWEANQDRFNTPDKLTLYHILLPRESQAKELKSRLQAGEDFNEIAGAYSIDPATRDQGGLVGEMVKGGGFLNQELEEVAFSLEEGEIGGPVMTPFGFHIVKVTDREAGRERAFEEAREDVRNALVETKKEEDFLSYIQQLKNEAVIDINEELLRQAP
jgi:hypothetical protein